MTSPFHGSSEPAPRPSRSRFFSSLPHIGATALAIRNSVYANQAIMLADDRILVWQDTGPWQAVGELNCLVGNSPLHLRADNLAGMEPRLEGFESFVPVETCAALVEHALANVLGYLERIAGVPIECRDFLRLSRTDHDASEISAGFALLSRDMRIECRGMVRTLAEVWRTFDFARQPALANRRRQALPVCLSVRVASARLTARMLSELCPGDAIRPESPIRRSSLGMEVILTDLSGRWRQQGRLVDDSLILEMDMTPGIDASTEPTDTGDQHVDLLDEIECEVTFELGSIRMSVAELSRMRAGQTVRLGVRLQDQPIRVLVNGRLIGRGELAAVGDELVVVVTDTSRLPNV